MKKNNLMLILMLINLAIYGQEKDTSSQPDNIYTDAKFGYTVKIPDWLTVKDIGHPDLWGGAMEPIGDIENAIIINGFTREDFKNIKKLKYDKVGQYKSGDEINYGQTFMLQKKLGEIENIGEGYKVQILADDKLYDCAYVFAETKKGLLWIIFTATPDTYNINIEKFKKFLNGLELIND